MKKFNSEQQHYLNGFLAGMESQGISVKDVALPEGIGLVSPAADAPASDLIREERIKREENPLDSYYKIVENARSNAAPDPEDLFRFKWSGLFYLTPVKEGYMARLRIPGGFLKTFQLREIANVARDLTTGYVQITTRANFQIRLIEPKNAPEVLRRIQGVGLHTRGAGADNVRNITANPTAGIDPMELIDVTPHVHELAQFILAHREFYDLPRKFNIAIDGGGLIGTVEDTNDIGARAVEVLEASEGVEPGIYFRLALGGATGHKAFARDLGVLVKPGELVEIIIALVRVFIDRGCRENRKRARLKHLLETMPLADYLAAAEKLLGRALIRHTASGDLGDQRLPPHSHVGAYPQKQKGLNYIGVTIPVGQITPQQMLRIADLADHYGSGEIRLTVWQNLVIPGIGDGYVETVKKRLDRMGLGWRQSNLASGFVACTGNRYCKFAATDTKGHAIELMKRLDRKFVLEQPINVHITGCPHSCAQHYMGDIGLLGAKTRDGQEAYHLFVGGGFGPNQAIGRQLFQSIPYGEVGDLLEKIIAGYLRRREAGESFLKFTGRHEINDLQAIFTNNE
jgi:ferredoxin-nitrite reductase